MENLKISEFLVGIIYKKRYLADILWETSCFGETCSTKCGKIAIYYKKRTTY